MKPKRRDVERLAALLRIERERKLYFSTRSQFNRIRPKVYSFIHKSVAELFINRYEAMNATKFYTDELTYRAIEYNQTWIVKRRAYGKRAKVRRYYAILDTINDPARRQRVIKRIKELSQ